MMNTVTVVKCPRCRGTGHEPYANPHTGVMEYGENCLCQNCDDCFGTGELVNGKPKCVACDGTDPDCDYRDVYGHVDEVK